MSSVSAEHAALLKRNSAGRFHDTLWFAQAPEAQEPVFAKGEEEDGVWEVGERKMNQKFTYDIAISFLDQDKSIADEIYDRLFGNYSIFLYSHHQDKLAGQDGEQAFTDVFKKESRLVVVLYRNGWGETGWTRIEQTGIRNRAFEAGYTFCIFVLLDGKSNIPEYIPKSIIYLNWKLYGIEGLISVIEYKNRELGGELKPETLEDRAIKKQTEIFKREKIAEYENGVQILSDRNRLFEEIVKISEAKCKSIKAKLRIPFIEIEVDRKDMVIFKGNSFALIIYNTMNDKQRPILEVELHRTTFSKRQTTSQLKLKSSLFRLGMNMQLEKSWFDSNNKSYSKEDIVDFAISELIEVQ